MVLVAHSAQTSPVCWSVVTLIFLPSDSLKNLSLSLVCLYFTRHPFPPDQHAIIIRITLTAWLLTSGGFWTISLSIWLYILCWLRLISLLKRVRRSESGRMTRNIRQYTYWTLTRLPAYSPVSVPTGNDNLCLVLLSIIVPSFASI